MSTSTGSAKIDPKGAIPVANIHIGFAQHSVWRCDLNDAQGNSLHQWMDSNDSNFSVLDAPQQILQNKEFLRWWITIMKATNDPNERIFVQVDLSQGGTPCMKSIKVDDKFEPDRNVYVAVVEVTFE